MYGRHRPVSTTSEVDVKGRPESTNEPSDRSVRWRVLWEFNRELQHTNDVLEADFKIERLKHKSMEFTDLRRPAEESVRSTVSIPQVERA